MKTISSIILRVVLALALGIVLIIYPLEAINYLVIIIGVLFLAPGLISILGYLLRNKQTSDARFPIESVGSSLLGLALILMPGFFVGALMYILSAILILAGFFQIRALFTARKQVAIPFIFYIIPVLILLVGVAILFDPFSLPKTTFIILGIACVIYALSETINYLKFLKNSK